MNDLSITNSLEGTPLTISATSMPSLDGMGTGAIRSSVFEINNSSSNVNFISHVWSCCSDLYFAVKACGPKGRQFDSSESNRPVPERILPTNQADKSFVLVRPNRFQRLKPIIRMKWDAEVFLSSSLYPSNLISTHNDASILTLDNPWIIYQ